MRDLLVDVHGSMCTSASTMVPGCFAIPVVYWWSANRIGLAIGMAIALAVSLPIFSYLKRLDVANHPDPMRLLVIANGAANGIWALLPIWMMPNQPDDQYLVLALPFAMLVTNLAATAPVRKIYLAGQIPLAIGAMAAFIILADGNTKWAAAVIGVTALTLDGLGQAWRRTAHRNVLLQHNNERLVEDLEATNIVLQHRSDHDHLTGLLNRRAFTEFVDPVGSDQQTALPNQGLAIMLIDLDRFKAVNDQHGHHYGDELLILVSNRLRSAVPTGALLSRLGGDEFAVAWTDAPSTEELMALAKRINTELSSPFSIDDRTMSISASVGVAVNSTAARVPTDVLRNADEALYMAKANGRDQAVAYDGHSNGRSALDGRVGRFDGGIESI